MKKGFNLKNFLQKKAFYEGAQGLMSSTRKNMDCQKECRDKGMGAQEAWQYCQDKFDQKKRVK